MRKILTLVICALLLVCLCACDEKDESSADIIDNASAEASLEESKQESDVITEESKKENSEASCEESADEASEEESLPEISEEESLPEVSEEESLPEVSEEESVPVETGITEAEASEAFELFSYANLFSFGPVTDANPGIFSDSVADANPRTILQFIAMMGRDKFLTPYTEYSDKFGYEAAYKTTLPIEVIDSFTTDIFGCTYDYTGITSSYEEEPYYDAANNAVVYFYGGGWGYGPVNGYEYNSYTKVDDNTVAITIDYNKIVDEENYQFEVDHQAVFTIQKQASGLWKIISFKKI